MPIFTQLVISYEEWSIPTNAQRDLPIQLYKYLDRVTVMANPKRLVHSRLRLSISSGETYYGSQSDTPITVVPSPDFSEPTKIAANGSPSSFTDSPFTKPSSSPFAEPHQLVSSLKNIRGPTMSFNVSSALLAVAQVSVSSVTCHYFSVMNGRKFRSISISPALTASRYLSDLVR